MDALSPQLAALVVAALVALIGLPLGLMFRATLNTWRSIQTARIRSDMRTQIALAVYDRIPDVERMYPSDWSDLATDVRRLESELVPDAARLS